MTFTEYLISKKIDPQKFKQAEPDRFAEWESAFETMHPNSFTASKLYLINPIRRKFLLAVDVTKTAEAQPAKVARPVMKPKPKIN